ASRRAGQGARRAAPARYRSGEGHPAPVGSELSVRSRGVLLLVLWLSVRSRLPGAKTRPAPQSPGDDPHRHSDHPGRHLAHLLGRALAERCAGGLPALRRLAPARFLRLSTGKGTPGDRRALSEESGLGDAADRPAFPLAGPRSVDVARWSDPTLPPTRSP